MSTVPRMTIPTQLVLAFFLSDPARQLYGYEISDGIGVATGTVHPILARLEVCGWLSSSWEQVDPAEAGRPARRYYALTAAGVGAATDALRKARTARGGRAIPNPVPGLS